MDSGNDVSFSFPPPSAVSIVVKICHAESILCVPVSSISYGVIDALMMS